MRRLPLMVLLLALVLPSCELFGDPSDALILDVPVSVTLPQALPILYPNARQIADLPVGSDGRRVYEVPPAYVSDFDIVALDPEVAQIADRIEGIEIAGVDVSISANSLSVPIAPILIGVGAAGQPWPSALPAAVTDTLPIGFEGVSQAAIIADNREQVTDELGTLRFGLGVGTYFVIPEGELPSGGRANAVFTVRIILKVSPL